MMRSGSLNMSIQWDQEVVNLNKDDVIFCLLIEEKQGMYNNQYIWAVLSKDGNYRGIKKSHIIPTSVRIMNLTTFVTHDKIIPFFNDPIESIMSTKPLIRRSDVENLKATTESVTND